MLIYHIKQDSWCKSLLLTWTLFWSFSNWSRPVLVKSRVKPWYGVIHTKICTPSRAWCTITLSLNWNRQYGEEAVLARRLQCYQDSAVVQSTYLTIYHPNIFPLTCSHCLYIILCPLNNVRHYVKALLA